eukprot:scaffold108_cov162-Amphora_coffeaeformis.AAC.3
MRGVVEKSWDWSHIQVPEEIEVPRAPTVTTMTTRLHNPASNQHQRPWLNGLSHKVLVSLQSLTLR